MSYILDALRRADAERDRGQVPSIHSQPAFTPPPVTTTRERDHRQSLKLSWIILVALGITMLSLLAIWRWSSQRTLATDPALAQSSAPPMPAAMAPRVELPPTPSPNPNPSPSQRPSPTVTPSAPPAVAAAPAQVPIATPPLSPAPKPIAAKPPAAPTVAATANVMQRHELPPDVQNKLPPLAMSGSVYSPHAKNRMVIVDGRLVIEGEQAAQGLIVERIHPKSVVLRFQGHRFEVPLT